MILLESDKGIVVEEYDWLQNLIEDEWVDAWPITSERMARLAYRAVLTYPGHRIISRGLDACVVLSSPWD